ncbi:hypothetical protein PV326_007251, partial [Microctonus aethiopoides]
QAAAQAAAQAASASQSQSGSQTGSEAYYVGVIRNGVCTCLSPLSGGVASTSTRSRRSIFGNARSSYPENPRYRFGAGEDVPISSEISTSALSSTGQLLKKWLNYCLDIFAQKFYESSSNSRIYSDVREFSSSNSKSSGPSAVRGNPFPTMAIRMLSCTSEPDDTESYE